jgi:hypothetical protein
VALLEEAEQLISARCRLKGTGHTLFEVLGPEETLSYQALKPHFVAAKVAGKRVQFKRAVLFVDGVRFLP